MSSCHGASDRAAQTGEVGAAELDERCENEHLDQVLGERHPSVLLRSIS